MRNNQPALGRFFQKMWESVFGVSFNGQSVLALQQTEQQPTTSSNTAPNSFAWLLPYGMIASLLLLLAAFWYIRQLEAKVTELESSLEFQKVQTSDMDNLFDQVFAQFQEEKLGWKTERTNLQSENQNIKTQNTQLKTENQQFSTANKQLRKENRNLKTKIKRLSTPAPQQASKKLSTVPTSNPIYTTPLQEISSRPLALLKHPDSQQRTLSLPLDTAFGVHK